MQAAIHHWISRGQDQEKKLTSSQITAGQPKEDVRAAHGRVGELQPLFGSNVLSDSESRGRAALGDGGIAE